MSELIGGKDKKEILKELIRRLHEGGEVEELKKQFKQLIQQTTPAEIAQIEEELIKEGMPREEIHRLCDIHLEAFRESVEKDIPELEAGHPLGILMDEHRILLDFAGRLRELTGRWEPENRENWIREMSKVLEHLRDSESHYLREENALFPYLEKHGITEPPSIMWMEHDTIRSMKKEVFALFERIRSEGSDEAMAKLSQIAEGLLNFLSSHFYKENRVLFPTALKVISSEEWQEIKTQFDEIGYFYGKKHTVGKPVERGAEKAKRSPTGEVKLGMGSLTPEELEAMLNTLPVDITFVGSDDRVKYFNLAPDRIFVRTKGVIGRTVQKCHPQKSVDVVERILRDFKSGKRDVAEFWLRVRGRMVHIRYFAVRSSEGKYLGTLEVTQDITEIQKLTGEKRIYDFEG